MFSHLETLIEGIAAGDHLAFERFYNNSFPKCYSFALYFTKSEELAKEAVAEVFLNIWKGRSKLPEIKNWESYIYVSIKNQALAVRKKYSDRQTEPIELFSIHIPAEDDNPEDALLKDEMETMIGEAFEQLPERCRIIYYMVKMEHMSYRQVAEILGISERTVNSQMTIAVKKLVVLLHSYFSSG